MSKTISKGTLGLRFMQNALRAKQQAEVELEQAKIKDEAEWEVSQEMKDAWGIGSSAAVASSSVTHESSYLPFLFDTEGEESEERRPKGRRTFNARGQEVDTKEEEIAPTPSTNEDAPDDSKSAGRLNSFSRFRVPTPNKKKDVKKVKTKTAQELIREDVKKRPIDPPQPPSGFLKPSGVHMPASGRPTRAPSGSSLKRLREPESADPRVSEDKKRKTSQKHSGIRLID